MYLCFVIYVGEGLRVLTAEEEIRVLILVIGPKVSGFLQREFWLDAGKQGFV